MTRQRGTTVVPERELPQNIEAERSILGAVLLDGEVFDRVADKVGSGEFLSDRHRRIFAAMGRLAEARVPIEMVTLREALAKAGDLEEVGGAAYLAGLADGMPRGSNVEHYAGIVAEKARLRHAIAVANRLLADAYEAQAPSRDIAGDASEALQALGGSGLEGKAVALSDLLSEGMEALETWSAKGSGAVTGLRTGFPELDDQTSGLQPGNLILIAARTSQGKSALMMNIARFAGDATTVLVFSLEMSRVELFLRLLASEAEVDSHRLRTANLQEQDWGRMAQAIGTLGAVRIFVDDAGGIGIREVRARARQVKAAYGLGLVVVDYIQLMKGRGSFDNRSQEIGTISRGLKAVAKELNVPVIALSQLNRQSEGDGRTAKRRPRLSDLAESGSLEQDADVVFLIYRPEPKEDETPPAEIIVAKQRNGPVGTILLHWNPQLVRFENRR